MIIEKVAKEKQKYEKHFLKRLPKDIRAHCRRVGKYSRILAENMIEELIKFYPEVDKELLLYAVEFGGNCHDIGKSIYAKDVLNKSGALSKAEMEALKAHSLRSAEIMLEDKDFKNSEGMLYGKAYKKIILDCCLYHHEHYDGSGYPDKLVGRSIPPVAQIVAVCDVFDALVAKRSYKETIEINKAMDLIIRESGKHFDPKIVEQFKNSIDEFKKVFSSLKSKDTEISQDL